jgi:hypothetical protein
LKEAAQTGQIELYYLDESGFAATLPLGYTWAREGTRPLVMYEAPQGRRVNVLGALAPFGAQPHLLYHSRAGKIDSGVLLELLWREVAQMSTPVGVLPPDYQANRLRVIVLDNYSVHRSKEVKAQLSNLQAVGVVLFYLPTYRPDLNLIEGVWRHTKYEDMPIRSYSSAEALKAAVEAALEKRAARLPQTVQLVLDELQDAGVTRMSRVHHSTKNLRKAA